MATLASRSQQAMPGVLARWHLLSLDGATVAALWTWFVARCAGVRLGWATPVTMFVAVWLLYVVDRLLDGRGVRRHGPGLELRHFFHGVHRERFQAAICVAVFALLALLLEMRSQAWNILRWYGGLGVLLAAWFGVIHLPRRARPAAPKELMTGMFFAAAVFLPSLVRADGLRLPLLLGAGCFGLLCWLNCLFIFRWEHALADAAHASTRVGVRWLRPMAGLALAVPLLLAKVLGAWAGPLLLAISLAAAGLLALDRWGGSLERTTRRAAADGVLLTPLLWLAFVR